MSDIFDDFERYVRTAPVARYCAAELCGKRLTVLSKSDLCFACQDRDRAAKVTTAQGRHGVDQQSRRSAALKKRPKSPLYADAVRVRGGSKVRMARLLPPCPFGCGKPWHRSLCDEGKLARAIAQFGDATVKGAR